VRAALRAACRTALSQPQDAEGKQKIGGARGRWRSPVDTPHTGPKRAVGERRSVTSHQQPGHDERGRRGQDRQAQMQHVVVRGVSGLRCMGRHCMGRRCMGLRCIGVHWADRVVVVPAAGCLHCGCGRRHRRGAGMRHPPHGPGVAHGEVVHRDQAERECAQHGPAKHAHAHRPGHVPHDSQKPDRDAGRPGLGNSNPVDTRQTGSGPAPTICSTPRSSNRGRNGGASVTAGPAPGRTTYPPWPGRALRQTTVYCGVLWSISPSARRSSHSAWGIVVFHRRTASFTCAGVRHPTTADATAGWLSGNRSAAAGSAT
jgi:hypothetical protein